MYGEYEERFRLMKYYINYELYPGFLSQMKKYNDRYKHLKEFKKCKQEVIDALRQSPRHYIPLNAHPLKGSMNGYYSISTGLNSNRDRVVYMIDDSRKTVFLKSIGDHSVYESYDDYLEYWKERDLI